MPDSTEPSDFPEPTAALVLWRITMEAQVASMSRAKGERFLRLVGERMADEANFADVLQIRPPSRWKKMRAARLEAAELFARCLPLFLAKLPRA
jgi:hypothetical protein